MDSTGTHDDAGGTTARLFPGASRDGDVKRRPWDVIVAPLHHQDVTAPLLQQVADVVLQVAQMFDQNLLTGDLGAVHAHQQHVLT